MANFLQSNQGAFANMPLYNPDFSFLAKVYDVGQQRYDRGFNMVKNLINSQLNGRLTNQNNELFRQDAFKKLETSLKSISGVDLSNGSNVMKATSIMDPISKDEDLAYDMAVTAYHDKQKQKMESFKNSPDIKIRSLYSDYAASNIGLAEEDLKDAKRGDGSIRKVQPQEFVLFEDVDQYLRDAAEKEKIKIVRSATKGMYIVKYTNGKETIGNFNEWAKNVIGDKFDRQFRVMGRVQSETSIRNLMKEKGLSREVATKTIAEELIKPFTEDKLNDAQSQDETLNELNERIDLYKKIYPEGFNANHREDEKKFREVVQKRNEYTEHLRQSSADLQTIKEGGADYVASNLQSLFTSQFKKEAAYSWASAHAQATAEADIRPDMVKLTQFKVASQERMSALDRSSRERIADKHLEMDKMKFAFEVQKENIKNNGKEEIVSTFQSKYSIPGTTILDRALSSNRSEQFNKAFGAETGLANLFVNTPQKYGEYYSVLAKLKNYGETGANPLNAQELKLLSEYSSLVGAKNYTPSNPSNALFIIDNLTSSTYSKASSIVSSYRASGKPIPKQFKGVANDLINSFTSTIQKKKEMDENYKQIARTILDENGNRREGYENAKIVGWLPDNITPIFDLTNVSTSHKEAVERVMSDSYGKRGNPPTGVTMNFEKISPSEISAMTNSNSIITMQGGEKINANVLATLNPTDFNKLFGGGVKVSFDPGNETISFKLNPSLSGGVPKSVGIKAGEEVTVTVPYATILANPALDRLKKYVKGYTVNPSSLGNMERLYNNQFSTVRGYEFNSNSGFDYTATGMMSGSGEYGVNVEFNIDDPRTNKKTQHTKFIPIENPSDADKFLKVQDYINKMEDYYDDQSELYDNENDKDEDYNPIEE